MNKTLLPSFTLLYNNMAETVDVVLKSLAILCLCSHARFIVVDGLGGIIQQGGYLLAVGYA